MKANPAQRLFNKGELDSLIWARTDYQGYGAGLKLAKNVIPLIQGPLVRRPGTVFVAPARFNDLACRLLAFRFSDTEAYALEFGDGYFRIYRDEGRVEDPPGTPITVSTPYPAADLQRIKTAQSADVMYLTHPRYAPRKVSRSSDTVWTVDEFLPQDGPYLPVNITATTASVTGTSGSQTLSFSSTTGINKNLGLRSPAGDHNGDVGRLVRLNTSGSAWGWMRITAVLSPTSASVDIQGTLGATGGNANWRLGVWNSVDGYPTCVCFFEDRLCFGGAGASPQRVDMSQSSAYDQFFPTKPSDATIADDYAVAASMNSSDVQQIVWMKDDERGLLVGTISGEWLIRGSEVQRNTVTPTNITAKQTSNYGSADIDGLRAGKPTLFVSNSSRKLRELAYVYTDDGYRAPDMAVLAAGMTKSGIRELVYQKEPQSIIWSVLNNNALRGFTYDREQQVTAWHRHEFGGFADEARTLPPEVLSLCEIPSPDLSYNQVWFAVRRWINGSAKVYIEYMTKLYERGDDQATTICGVDSALVYEGAATSSIASGLEHLVGQTVDVLGGGAAHPPVTIGVGGTATFTRPETTWVLGLRYDSDVRSLRFDAGSANGSSLGKIQNISVVRIEVQDTLGVKLGPSFDNMSEVTFRTSADPTETALPLRSGVYDRKPWSNQRDGVRGLPGRDENVCVRWYQPFPGALLALLPTIDTTDDGG